MAEIIDIDVHKIENPDILLHPNPDLDGLRELAQSIKQTGQHQEIVVRKSGDRYKLIIGYRRVKAAKTFGIPVLRARIADMNEKDALLATATENLQRLEQDPIKEAELYKNLTEKWTMSEGEIAEKFGKSTQYIKSRLALLELAQPVKDMIDRKEINLGVAGELSKLPLESDQVLIAANFREQPVTVERAKAFVKDFSTFKEAMPEESTEKVIDRAREEPQIRCLFCTEEKNLSKVKTANICDTCFSGAIYLFEKEKRATKE